VEKAVNSAKDRIPSGAERMGILTTGNKQIAGTFPARGPSFLSGAAKNVANKDFLNFFERFSPLTTYI
jgi:hypothetical protein